MPIWSILVFPALFTAGMSLVDTTDSMLMLGAYGWAFAKPIRKLYYNMTITFVSVLVAVLVGGIEALGLIGDQLGLAGRSGTASPRSTTISARIGYLIIAVFVLSWLVAAASTAPAAITGWRRRWVTPISLRRGRPVPAIHAALAAPLRHDGVEARNKPAHDGESAGEGAAPRPLRALPSGARLQRQAFWSEPWTRSTAASVIRQHCGRIMAR